MTTQPKRRRRTKAEMEQARRRREAALPETKVCVRCDEEKGAGKFSRDKRRKDGLFPYCMACQMAGYRKMQDSDGKLTGRKCGMCLTPLRGNESSLVLCAVQK